MTADKYHRDEDEGRTSLYGQDECQMADAMSEYTPTTEDVREVYKSGAWLRADDQESAWKPEVYAPRYYAEFDRWLAQHDAEVRAQALRDAARYVGTGDVPVEIAHHD